MAKLLIKLPHDVQAVNRALARSPSHDLSTISAKLIAETSELAAMWRALEKRRCGADDLWVWGFLRAAASASNLQPYHHMTEQAGRALLDKSEKLAKRLSRALEANELDAHLIYSDGKLLNGIFV